MWWPLLWLLLPLAALSGWWAAKRSQSESSQQAAYPSEYFKGINFILNEQPDKAVDVFVKMLEVNSDTVETHLALGNLFRRRGEVNRAIRIHQNLIARPNLDKKERTQCLMELGQDYLRAGVFDRAESLFLDLLHVGKRDALVYLLEIYQQQREWEKAIKIAEQMQGKDNHEYPNRIAHYHCALAEEALTNGQNDLVIKHLNRALGAHYLSLRANLLKAKLDQQSQRYKEAVLVYQRIAKRYPHILAEIIDPLLHCASQSHQLDKCYQSLLDLINENTPISVLTALFKHWPHLKNNQTLLSALRQRCEQQPSLYTLKFYLSLYNEQGADKRTYLQQLNTWVDKLLDDQHAYRCGRCGFSAKSLHWQCPSCRQWDSFKPVIDIVAEEVVV